MQQTQNWTESALRESQLQTRSSPGKCFHTIYWFTFAADTKLTEYKVNEKKNVLPILNEVALAKSKAEMVKKYGVCNATLGSF